MRERKSLILLILQYNDFLTKIGYESNEKSKSIVEYVSAKINNEKIMHNIYEEILLLDDSIDILLHKKYVEVVAKYITANKEQQVLYFDIVRYFDYKYYVAYLNNKLIVNFRLVNNNVDIASFVKQTSSKYNITKLVILVPMNVGQIQYLNRHYIYKVNDIKKSKNEQSIYYDNEKFNTNYSTEAMRKLLFNSMEAPCFFDYTDILFSSFIKRLWLLNLVSNNVKIVTENRSALNTYTYFKKKKPGKKFWNFLGMPQVNFIAIIATVLGVVIAFYTFSEQLSSNQQIIQATYDQISVANDQSNHMNEQILLDKEQSLNAQKQMIMNDFPFLYFAFANDKATKTESYRSLCFSNEFNIAYYGNLCNENDVTSYLFLLQSYNEKPIMNLAFYKELPNVIYNDSKSWINITKYSSVTDVDGNITDYSEAIYIQFEFLEFTEDTHAFYIVYEIPGVYFVAREYKIIGHMSDTRGNWPQIKQGEIYLTEISNSLDWKTFDQFFFETKSENNYKE